MKNFEIKKNFTEDNGESVLVILIEHKLNKDKWKDRFLLFNSESATYKIEKRKEKQLWQTKQTKSL